MLVSIDQVETNGANVRRAPVAPEEEAALKESIAALGILQPLLVHRDGDRFKVVAGARRLAAARDLGMAQVPVEVTELDGAKLTAAAFAENAVRAAMSDVDWWRAIVRLQGEGMPLRAAARAIGVDDRTAGRLSLLGRMAPAIIEQIERDNELPPFSQLRAIASAPVEAQAKAAKRLIRGGRVSWHDLAMALRCERIPRARAIFDVEASKIAWEEDLFAQPGSDEQWTTRDAHGFMKAQTKALEARISGSKGQEEFGTFKAGHFEVPKGWQPAWDEKEGGKLKRGQKRLVAIADDASGFGFGKLLTMTIEPAAKKAPAAKPPVAPTGSILASEEGGPVDASDLPTAVAEAPERDALTRTGHELLASAKTLALRAAIRNRDWRPVDLIACLALALYADNVEVRGRERVETDQLATLVDPQGVFIDQPSDRIMAAAADVLARSLWLQAPHRSESRFTCGSGRVAEWIGAAIGASAEMPRLDTPEFLAQVSGTELKSVANKLGMKAMKVTALREALVGNAPNMRPSAADFGALGLRPPAPTDDTSEEQAA